jgi:hypothetical protein
MKALFDALRSRYRANSVLRTKGRDLYLGLREQERPTVTKPYAEVNLEMTERLDTFDSDVETWSATFRFHTNDIRTNPAHEWLEALQEAYKDARIASYAFHCAGMRMMRSAGPSASDGGYDASATFNLFIQRLVNSPLVRGA